ncbi:ankyrin repeat domain-containing protein [Mangrovimicrobium sediminis]|nr:ankyrin repeat domain-containing protein [Haliea sp. SAOS-164]
MLSDNTRAWMRDNGFDPAVIDAPGKYADTALMLACRHGATAIALELLGAGADHAHRNMDGTDALWACVVSNNVELADALLAAGTDIDNQNDNGATALMYAASAGKTQWVKYFLERGADTGRRSLDDFSALDLASNIECLRLLRASA